MAKKFITPQEFVARLEKRAEINPIPYNLLVPASIRAVGGKPSHQITLEALTAHYRKMMIAGPDGKEISLPKLARQYVRYRAVLQCKVAHDCSDETAFDTVRDFYKAQNVSPQSIKKSFLKTRKWLEANPTMEQFLTGLEFEVLEIIADEPIASWVLSPDAFTD